jgi:hypothetical protein
MRLARSLTIAACAALCAAPAAQAHFGAETTSDASARWGTVKPFATTKLAAAGQSVPVVTSPNVRLVTTYPGIRGISGAFSHTGSFFYVSGLDSIHVFDVSNPLQPVPKGVLPNIIFENEAMTYGERKNAAGKLERFLLVGNDLYQASVDRQKGPTTGNVGGGEVMVVDVTDPANPFVRSRVRSPRSTHTVHCMTLSCEQVYTSGSGGQYAVVDLTSLDTPKAVGSRPSPGAGHFWDIDDAGIAWSTGSQAAAHDFKADPLNPPLITTTNAQGKRSNDKTGSPWNNFILHNSKRPNAKAFAPEQEPDLGNGNVLLVSEEDYDETDCRTGGSFQTWHINKLDGTPESVTPLDLLAPTDFGGPVSAAGGISPPNGATCSAHWFDVHQSGVVALGTYATGLRFIDVRQARDIKPYGHLTAGAMEVWDAYFVPERDKDGVQTGRKTNVVYTVDAVRGIDVVEVDLPAADEYPAGPKAKKAKKTK